MTDSTEKQNLKNISFFKRKTFCSLLLFTSSLGPESGKCDLVPGGVDNNWDHTLLLLHLQTTQPSAVLHQMGQVQKQHGMENPSSAWLLFLLAYCVLTFTDFG